MARAQRTVGQAYDRNDLSTLEQIRDRINLSRKHYYLSPPIVSSLYIVARGASSPWRSPGRGFLLQPAVVRGG